MRAVFNRVVYTALGALWGLGIPFLWLVWRAYSARQPWWDAWLKTEFKRNGEVYGLLGLWAALIVGAIGYFLGRRHDELEHEALSALNSNVELNELANTDGLTALLNARAIHERLDVEIENAHDRLAPLSCLLIDIDHFKKINDQYGHPFGDAVLAAVAKILRRQVRRLDMVGRLGGEEFLIVMPSVPQEAALAAAERIRSHVEEELFLSEDKRVRVTVSVGVARFPANGLKGKDGLLKAVDEALYAAKKSGRNRVLAWPL